MKENKKDEKKTTKIVKPKRVEEKDVNAESLKILEEQKALLEQTKKMRSGGIILCVIGALFCLVGLISNFDKVKGFLFPEPKFTDLTVAEYLELIESDEEHFIYIGRPTCGYCQQYEPIMKEAMKETGKKIYYFNTDQIASEEEYYNFMESLAYLENEEWGTPLVLRVKNGEVYDASAGLASKEETINFLNKKVTEEDKIVYKDHSFTKLTMDEYNAKIKENKINVVYYGLKQCSSCKDLEAVLEEVKSEKGTEVFYFDVSEINGENYDEFVKDFPSLSAEESYIPFLILTRNGKEVASYNGTFEKDEIIKFLDAHK